MQGRLFTQYFVEDGIRETPEWRDSKARPASFDAFRAAASRLLGGFSRLGNPNEAETEHELIRPVLEALGWADYLLQQGTERNEGIPDHLLFADAESKARAARRANSADRYRDALLVQESKRFGLSLDGRERGGSPHDQIRRYLDAANDVSGGRIRWGILTNGGVWRLYDRRAHPRATAYFEADLVSMLDRDDERRLRVFYLLFRREAFLPEAGATATFIESALDEGRRYEERVAQDLSRVVFDEVFPALVNALARDPANDLREVRDAALIFLYRLLFLLYAEDRGLLPVNDPRYDDYGLRKRVRDDVARRKRDRDVFSQIASSYFDHLSTLFRLIDRGDQSIGLPPYNGGLFSEAAAPILNTARLPDSLVADVMYALSHVESDGKPRFVNYRDMSVQQLGSIYERLLEREPVSENGSIVIRPNPYARKDSGSFYTPQELVDLIVERTLKPLVEERLSAFEKLSEELTGDRRPKEDRLTELAKLDPAEAVLNLKVLDPAMGSGHFLVTAVDFLSDYVADLLEYAPAVSEWLDEPYESPLVGRVQAIRDDILNRARESNWVLDEAQLTDQAIIRRMILKRCIYGVDKNALTVELAKVSLWLHSFTVGAPLSFLDHHLRYGDSLVGLRVLDGREELNRLGGLFASSAIQAAENAAEGMQMIEEMSDADVSEVRESAELFQDVEEATAELRGLLDFLTGVRWLTAGMTKKARVEFEAPLVDLLEQDPQSTLKLLSGGPGALEVVNPGNQETSVSTFMDVWSEIRSIVEREAFLHWEAAFPGVWRRWQDSRPQGGFDAVIGNPPWDRIKLQEVEWFATRDPELAQAPTAAARRTQIQRLRAQGDPLAAEFDDAKNRADSLGQVVRASGDYPLLGGGDINIYSLFVERAMSLVKPGGLVGLLTPSGIYADKTAAQFFKSVSTSGRVSGLYDFENRKIFFKDVHASFKFCALIFGGAERTFPQTECAFFLHDTEAIDDPERSFPLSPTDFARVNPNTGTAPVFRTRRDADITRRIYESHPVLVDRSGDAERRAWPVRYATMFHMAGASHLFLTAEDLDAAGFYRVEGNHWKRGEELYVPMYQGRMIHQFDHRANSVRVNPENITNPYLSEAVSDNEHADPDFLPQSQYWVPSQDVNRAMPDNLAWTIAYRRIARSTDERTMIAAAVPACGYGDSVFLLMPDSHAVGAATNLLVGNFNSFAFDYITRQKLAGTNLSWYIVEQLPVIAPDAYDRRFGNTTARELVRDHVLRLTYTSHDMAAFARDLGYDGPPFTWDTEERRHLRARLDALYFHLYGLSREDAAYVMDTFPIVRREDEKAHGNYRTRDMTLAYMSALAAGDTETIVAV